MIHRRDFVYALAGLPLLANEARAAVRCTPFNMMGVQQCETGVRLGTIQTVRQRKMHWCWAASIAAVFGVHGYKVDQRRIVEKIFGDENDHPAAGPQIIEAINGSWETYDGEDFDAEGEVLWDTQFFFGRPDAIPQAAQELIDGNPLIIGTQGHATVLTAMTYLRNVYTQGQILSLTVRDPWPLNPNLRNLRGDEALATQFLCTVHVC
jgi:hypothetical protein